MSLGLDFFIIRCRNPEFICKFANDSGKASGNEGSDAKSVIRQELPDGFAERLPDNKSESYRNRMNVSTEEYFEMLAYTEDDISLISGDQAETEQSFNAEQKESAAERIFGPASEESRRLSPIDKPSTSLAVQMTPDEKLEYDMKRAEMIKDVLTDPDDACVENTIGGTDVKDAGDRPVIDFRKSSVNDDIILNLDDVVYDTDINAPKTARPLKCMFIKSQKVYDGERIKVRLLEDYIADGISIPANTHLTAVCKLGKRLELSVLSIQMNGIIAPLSLEAYDTDGLPGIYCPETISSKSTNQASNDAISAAGSNFGGLVGGIANTIIRTGANLARSANGKAYVSIVSGY